MSMLDSEVLVGELRGRGWSVPLQDVPTEVLAAEMRARATGIEAALAPGGVPRGTPVREDAGFSTGDEAPRVCVAVRGGRWRNELCGDPVEPDAEGDLCPRHQNDATAIGRQVIGLLRTIRRAERGAE